MTRPLTAFEASVLHALPSFRGRSASTVARTLYGLLEAYRYVGTIGRALQRLAKRGLVAHDGGGWWRTA